ncbi:MAG: SDR family oxidoreductase [Nocardioidaceae bacterium]
MDLGLRDRVFVVTGASRGLGRATATLLVAEGARVVVSSRSRDHLDPVVDALGRDNATPVVADNADPDTPRAVVAAAFERFGRLDGALISVGGPPAGPIAEKTPGEWREYVDSIFLGGLRLTITVAKSLQAGGSIALVLSTSVKQPIANLGMSNALRPGLAMAAKTLADELGPRGIRINGLLPGRVETERVQELDAASDDPRETRRRHLQTIPLRRYGRPEEFAAMAAFLLSPAAAYITGAMVPVDGGISRGL